MKVLRSIDYFSVIKYLLLFALFTVFNRLEQAVYPYSVALLAASVCLSGNVFVSSALYLLSFIVCGANGLIASAAISDAYCIAISLIYRKYKTKHNFAFTMLASFAVLSYLILGDTVTAVPLEKRAIFAAIAVALTFFCTSAGYAVIEKGLKFKLSYEEAVCLATVTVATGLGICNLLTPYVWKGICAFLILCACYLLRFGMGSFISAVLGISYAIFFKNVDFVAIFLCIGMFADVTGNLSRYLSAVAIVIADYGLYLLTGIYEVYDVYEYLPVIIAAVAFAAIPPKPFKALKEKLYSFRERQLVRQTINRNRLMLSNRLYELAGVFTEMSSAFTAFGKSAVTEDKAKAFMEKEIKNSVCKNCKLLSKCRQKQQNIDKGIAVMTDIGFAKGKLSLIDLPKDISDACIRPNDIIYGLNKMLAEYRAYALNMQNIATGRELIAEEAEGVSEMLKGLALESGALLKYQSRFERRLSENLLRQGFLVCEVLIYGENERLSVSMIIAMKEFSLQGITAVVSKTLGVKMSVAEKSNFSESKTYLFFKRAAERDAVFGIAKAVKDGSDKSGDTHSIVRINDEKFLVALSDGMGSGKQAENVSSVSLSLIESFYKAGMESPLILNTVNKLLSVNTEENFTALDVAVIDLKNKSADFVKYGSPYGFILSEGRVRIVEANTLPLGILNDLKPSVCKANIDDGDMILLMTDGVSDAFGSSGEIIDYIRVVPALNPQSLADDVLNKALELNKGEKKDDMTVLCVRIFKSPQINTA